MKISLFLSVNDEYALSPTVIGRQAALACASEKLAANVVPMFSSIEDEGEEYDNHHIESGCRIDLLLVAVNRLPDVLYLWKRLQDMLSIRCMYIEVIETSHNGGYWKRGNTNWVETTISDQITYRGCICGWPYYRTDYRLIHVNGPISCNPGTEAKSDNARLDAFEKDAIPVRYGKPLC